MLLRERGKFECRAAAALVERAPEGHAVLALAHDRGGVKLRSRGFKEGCRDGTEDVDGKGSVAIVLWIRSGVKAGRRDGRQGCGGRQAEASRLEAGRAAVGSLTRHWERRTVREGSMTADFVLRSVSRSAEWGTLCGGRR